MTKGTPLNTKLTIVIPTYNRSTQATQTLKSISDVASGVHREQIRVILVDNNSTPSERDGYIAAIHSFSNELDVQYLHEGKQGRSHACNAGANEASSNWIAFVDDDETLSPQWIDVALALIETRQFSYFGGSVLPTWEIPPPPWLPIHQKKYLGVLGWLELSDIDRDYDTFDASLCGGNMIVRRDLYLNIGGFSSALGRGASNLLGGEDGEFHRRLKSAKAKGCYITKLAVFHWVPIARMTLDYHRKWAYWSGVSNRIRIITEPQTAERVPHLFGVPRYRFSTGSRGLFQFLIHLATGTLKKRPEGVIGLLDFMYLIGLLRGMTEGKKMGINMSGRSTQQQLIS
jgi:glycosyltransferase involved in cell wall biosynthesis